MLQQGCQALALAMTMLIAALLLSVQTAPASPPPPPPAINRRPGRLFISPMGEPFRPSDRSGDGLADWFHQADSNQDGRVTLEEMQADADRFFAALDINHDGEIDPDEIQRYEDHVLPESQSGASFAATSEGGGSPGERGGGRRGGHGHRGASGGSFIRWDNDQHQGAGRFGLLDLPEPVMAADTNFNRGVSQAEFRAAASERFVALDLDHHGYLSLATLETIHPAPPPMPNKPPEEPITPPEY